MIEWHRLEGTTTSSQGLEQSWPHQPLSPYFLSFRGHPNPVLPFSCMSKSPHHPWSSWPWSQAPRAGVGCSQTRQQDATGPNKQIKPALKTQKNSNTNIKENKCDKRFAEGKSESNRGSCMVYVHHLDDPIKINGLIFHALALWSLGWGALNSPGSLESWLNRSA